MKATLEQITGGDVEIPVGIQHYQVVGADGVIYRGYGGAGAGADLDCLMIERVSALWWHFWESWPASCDWTVEWEDAII